MNKTEGGGRRGRSGGKMLFRFFLLKCMRVCGSGCCYSTVRGVSHSEGFRLITGEGRVFWLHDVVCRGEMFSRMSFQNERARAFVVA